METYDLGDGWKAVILHDVQTGKATSLVLKHRNRIVHHEKLAALPYLCEPDLMRELNYRKTLAASGYRAAILDMRDRMGIEFRAEGG